MLARVLQTLQMSILGGILARPLVPRTPVLVRVLQTLQMSILGGIIARLLVPRTPVLVRVLQTLQMSIHGGILARPLVPRTPVLVRVLQTLQMSIQAALSHVTSSQGHPCSCAYFKHAEPCILVAHTHGPARARKRSALDAFGRGQSPPTECQRTPWSLNSCIKDFNVSLTSLDTCSSSRMSLS